MAAMDQDFWRRGTKALPGLFDLGAGVYGMRAGEREADKRLQEARGPAYDAAMAASGQALTAAGNMDPRAAAAERLKAQQGLLAGKDAADETALIRMLHAKGMLDAGVYNPGVEGIAPGSTPMNPQLAAFYAARGGRDAKMAADSLDMGDAQVDRMLQRSGMLANQANAQQRAGIEAAKLRPSRAAGNMNLLKGASSIFKDMGGFDKVGGLFGKGFDWLSGNSPYASGNAAWGGGGDFDWFDAW